MYSPAWVLAAFTPERFGPFGIGSTLLAQLVTSNRSDCDGLGVQYRHEHLKPHLRYQNSTPSPNS